MGDAHIGNGLDTPMQDNAFEKSDEEKMDIIEDAFTTIMDTLGLDLDDDSLQDTPRRVAKMYVQEIFKGLNPNQKPEVSVFENKYGYERMLVEKDINVQSTCEHHFLPIVGKAHVGYISNGQVIGLSKINRIVDYYARRPQVQERMTRQIVEGLQEALDSRDVIVVIEAVHMCVVARGIQDTGSTTLTIDYSGAFEDKELRKEFMDYLKLDLKR